jgi:hypothetical protein
MKSFQQTIAWTGAVFMLPAIYISLAVSDNLVNSGPDEVNLVWIVVPPLLIIGMVLMLTGGILGRPKYFWPVCIILGVFYSPSNYGLFRETIKTSNHNYFNVTNLLEIWYRNTARTDSFCPGYMVKSQRSETGNNIK